MIKIIEDNDIVQVINLMHDIHGSEGTEGYSHNQAAWVKNFMIIYYKSKEVDEAVVFGYFDDDKLVGFISGDLFTSFYDDRVIADMKDCVTTGKRGLVFTKLLDAFLEHYKSIGVLDWRFDSIKKDPDNRDRLVDFISKRYSDTNDIELFVSVRGVQKEDSNASQ